MKEKGFTMVELLGVITLLGLLAMILYPTINRYITNSKNQLSSVQTDNILKAAKTWGADHITSLPTEEGESLEVDLKTLQDEGYIDSDLKDPETKKTLNATAIKVRISYQNGNLKYRMVGK